MQVIERCRSLAACTEEPGWTTRTFLSPPMREVHARVGRWMEEAGMSVTVDNAGNIRGAYAARRDDAPRLYIGSHLDTVPHAGAFDGILGVVSGIALVEALKGRRLIYSIEVIGFSEEEGVRFGVPFIGSRAFVGDVDEALLATRDRDGISVAGAIRNFGLDPGALPSRDRQGVIGFLEIHIEQGPVLEARGVGLAAVDAIAGQSRCSVAFTGAANHAGTTPMRLRRDALACAAEWVVEVERVAASIPDLVATVGRIEAHPGATNVIAGETRVSLDVRHADDETRSRAANCLLACASEIAHRRSLSVSIERQMDQASVRMDPYLTAVLERAIGRPERITSGAGHDAMIVARRMPAAMLFVRSPGGISHHPDESVLPEDVEAALNAGSAFLEELEASLA